MWLVIKCSAPMLITSLVIGLIISIFGRTTAVVHAVVNCYAPTIIQTYDTPSIVI